MNEVTKLYENAGVEPDINYVCDKEPCEKHSVDCQECSHLYDTREDYPDFTAEKQISLIIFLSYKYGKGLLINLKTMDKDIDIYDFELFGECLAKLVNELWQSLTEEEKQQINEILG